MRVHRVLLIGVCGLLAATALFAGSDPVAVSPGDASKLVLIGDTCPTFSWGEVDGASDYELVVYRLGDEGKEARQVLRQRFPGSVYGWTPALDQCLERGGGYAWSVRAAGAAAASEWSAPRLFQVAAGPSRAESEAALEVVRGYLDAGDGVRSTVGTEGIQAGSERASLAEATVSSPEPRAVGTTQLSVDGGIEAASFTGDGSTLTSLDPVNLSAGTAAIDISGTAAMASDLAGVACVSESELDFDPATQEEMAAHGGDASAHHTPPTELPPSGVAGGDLTGSYPNPGVVAAIARDAEIVPTVLAGDGSGSGLDADTLDGLEAAELQSYVPDNLARNSSFERFSEGDDTYPDSWHLLGTEEAPNGVSRITPGIDMVSAVRVQDFTTAQYCIQQIVYPDGELPDRLRGSDVTLSAWAKWITGTGDQPLAVCDGVDTTWSASMSSSEWTRVVVTHTVATGATRLTVDLCPGGVNHPDTGQYEFDAVMLTVGTAEPDYRPGPVDQLAGGALSVATLHVEGDAGIGTASPSERLEVVGNVKATAFLGIGSALTSLNPGNLSAGTAGINISGNAATATNADTLDTLDSSAFATAPALTGHVANTANPHAVALEQITPTTAKGDLLVEDGADVMRLPVGADGQVLVADSNQSGGVKWETLCDACPDCTAPALVPRTGQTTSHGDRDDGELQRGVAWPNPRFTDNGNGTVTDNLTGLIWLKNAGCFGAIGWADALAAASGLGAPACGLSDGSTPWDWRLPSRFELESLLALGFRHPALPNTAGTAQWSEGNAFSGVALSYYWSSTTREFLDNTYAWLVGLHDARVDYVLKTDTYHVWPVRGGQ